MSHNIKEYNRQPGDDSTLVGFMIGIVICAIVTLFSMCSCSRKVTEHIEISDSTTLSHNASTTINAEGILNASTQSLTDIMQRAESSWHTTTTRIYYSPPDSLGNQFVTSREETITEGGKQAETHINKSDSSATQSQTKLSVVTNDSTTTTHVSHTTADKTTTSIPWYYKYSLYGFILSILIIAIYILIRYFHSSLMT